jgi:hypothetical protein
MGRAAVPPMRRDAARRYGCKQPRCSSRGSGTRRWRRRCGRLSGRWNGGGARGARAARRRWPQQPRTRCPGSAPAQFARLKAELERGSLARGFADQRWTLMRIKTRIGRRSHIDYTVQRVRYLLRRGGWSCRRPARSPALLAPTTPSPAPAPARRTSPITRRRPAAPGTPTPPLPGRMCRSDAHTGGPRSAATGERGARSGGVPARPVRVAGRGGPTATAGSPACPSG